MQIIDLIKAMIPLIVIVGLLYGALYFIRKYGSNLRRGKSGSISINVISSQMIMPKKFISVVKIENKLLILGISEHSITLLKEMEGDLNLYDKSEENAEKNNFLEILKKNMGMK